MACRALALFAAIAGLSATACSTSMLPDPRTVAHEYAAAARKNDARAVYALLTDDARATYGLAGTQRLLADARKEIADNANAMASARATVRASAEVRYVDGESAVLAIEHGHYRISAAAGLPSAARTPSQALGELRGALSRRNYPALVRLLSNETRAAVEGDLRSLVTGLERPDALPVKIHGETAEVEIPGGHKVLLKREAGVWRIHDFD
jgi:ketosteroid isomerase-like protein